MAVINIPPTLSLAVQYPCAAPLLPRARLRRWVRQALYHAARHASPRTAPCSVPHTPALRGAQFTLRIVDTDEARQLNREYRQRDYATNVLTFAYGLYPDGRCHADIVLCLPVMQAEARAQNKPAWQHAAHLVIHGVLHALGYDHLEPDDALRMEALEAQILARLKIAHPYSLHAGNPPENPSRSKVEFSR